MPATTRLQDLPPEGGYNPISFKRVPLKPILSVKLLFGGYVAVSSAALYIYYLTYREITRDEIEMRSARNVIFPILLAERDRDYLKQIRKNRDEEAKLMANVPGWVVGTWYGEPIYKTKTKDDWFDPDMQEFYGQTATKYFLRRAHLKEYT